ncbi:MAG TPA: glycosyltransferase family 39 protein, partial [Polyangiaceae bacterium]|nr:glycosyltransferase family 39 protein [Polyangiaceae bacterium]
MTHALPASDPRVERAARVVVALVTVGFALAASWEIAGPLAAGHYAAASAVATGGENMWRWGVLAPVTHYLLAPPHDADFYCHHPWGIFWTAALFVKLLGHHFWVCRLPAVLMSASMPPLLYALGRAIWGPVAGAASAAGFAVLPIALAFANFFALEVPVMFGMTVGMWGYVRLTQTGRRRWLLTALGGLLYAMHADWVGFVFAALLLPSLFVRGFLLRRFFPPLAFRRFALFWALLACLSIASAAFYLLLFYRLGQLQEFLQQGEFRSAGSGAPLARVLEARRPWIDASFTPFAIVLGKVAAPLLVLRFLLRRRDGELLPLLVLGTALFQYLVFKQGADIHVFWPHYFALYFALALGALTRTIEGGFERVLVLLRRPRFVALSSLLCLAGSTFVAALIVPDGVRALGFARKTGGRFNEKGSIIQPDIDKEAALELISQGLAPAASVGLHSGMKQSYWMDWVLERPLRSARVGRSGGGGDRYFIADSRFAAADELESMATTYSVTAFGPFWFVDRKAPRGSFDALSIVRREPSVFERFFVLGSHALRSIEPDPWARWELSD